MTAGWTSGGAQTAGRVHCLTSRAHRPGGVGTMAVLLATSVKANIIKQKKVAPFVDDVRRETPFRDKIVFSFDRYTLSNALYKYSSKLLYGPNRNV